MFHRVFQVSAFLSAALIATLAVAQDDGAAQGAQLASSGAAGVPSCASCHGAAGEGMPAAGFPMLAGLNEGYFVAQLAAMKSGERALNPVMKPVIDGLDDTQIRAVAKYYASLAPPAAKESTADLSRGEWLVDYGNWDRGVPACAQCHGPGAEGVGAAFPRLAGQGATYVKSQLEAFKADKRKNDANGLMTAVAKKMSDEDIAAVAAYLETAGGAP